MERWNPYDYYEDDDNDDGIDGTGRPSTTTMTTEPCVLCELYALMRHMSAHPYLATISGSGARDGKRLIVIVKRAARIPVVSYFLSSWSHSRLM